MASCENDKNKAKEQSVTAPNVCLKINKKCKKSSKMKAKINKNYIKNLLKSGPEAFLEGSGGYLGPRWLQEPKKRLKIIRIPPKMKPTWRPKSIKIEQEPVQDRFKIWSFCWSSFGSKFGVIWYQLGANMGPKTLSKGSQVGFQSPSKIASYFRSCLWFPNSSLLFRVLAVALKRIKEGKKIHRGWAAKPAGPPVRKVALFGFLIVFFSVLDFLWRTLVLGTQRYLDTSKRIH